MRFVTKTQSVFLLPLDIAILEILWYPCKVKGVKLWLRTELYHSDIA